VAAGAPVATNHWAFRPVAPPPVPEVRHTRWARTDVDRFILASLESRQLAPSPEAGRRTLLRRAAFDLLGLPPTPDQSQEFLSDPSPEAWDHLVEKLLASERYGERWGRHWLDVARYADNKGYVFFEEKTYPWAYTYRDYVIRAFNQDLPYDRFIREQLAADLQPSADTAAGHEALAALGFITVGDHLVNNTHDILDDRIDVVSRGLLGLTAGCARCHDHKFDPITQADYYGLYGVFRSSTEPLVPPVLRVPAYNEEYEQFELEPLARERRLRDFVGAKHREIVEGGRRRVEEYLAAAHAARGQPITENFMVLADKGDVNPTVVMRWRILLERDTDVRHRVWGPWHVLTRIPEDRFASLAGPELAGLLAVGGAGDSLNPRVRRAFSGAPPSSMREGITRYAALLGEVDREWRTQVEEATRTGRPPPTALADPAAEELRRILYGPQAPPDVPGTMDWGFISLLPDRASQGEFQSLISALEQWMMRGPGAPPRAMVLVDARTAYEPHVFLRGNPNRPGAAVERRFFAALSPDRPPFHEGSGRRELAEAIVDANNPLTARVVVNRVWAHHFGAGLVATPSDFGRRSDPPSHPGLLDHLASGLMGHGWSIKWLQREILKSATYRQSSRDRAECLSVDPENRLLWRMNRQRHDFETLRDSLLAVSGRLDLAMGGPPVSLSAPRRTVYTFVDRMDLPPLLSTFDFPSPSSSCPQRIPTTVAPQALYLMNNGFLREVSQNVLTRPDLPSGERVEARVDWLYERLYGRPATRGDQALAHAYLSQVGKDGWTAYVQGLLMANEFVFVD
jgi:hypothetical protein